MAIQTPCPSCQTVFSLPDHYAGKTVRCKKCNATFNVRSAKGRAVEDVEESELVSSSGVSEEIPSRGSTPRRPLVRDEDETAPPRRRTRDDEQDSPRPRRDGNRGLLIGLIVGCAVLALLLGGGVFIVILVLVLHTGNDSTPFNSVTDMRGGGAWPAPPPLRASPDTIATLYVSGVADEFTRDVVSEKLQALLSKAGNSRMTSSSNGDRMTIMVAPVGDVNDFAQKVDFGEVQSVNGRTITVVARAVEGPSGKVDAVTKAWYYLKSANPHRRADAARQLKGMRPDQRQGDIVKALSPLLNDPDQWVRREAIEAIAVWGGQEIVPLLLKALREKETRKDAIKALGRLKDERAAEPIAESLDNIFERGEAVEALKQIGPGAEKAVLAKLDNPEWQVRQAACDILKVIGTKQSIPSLEKVVAEKNVFVSPKAKDAIQSINSRQ